MNEIALSAWRVDESDFPSGGSIEEKLRFAVNYAILAPSSHLAVALHQGMTLEVIS